MNWIVKSLVTLCLWSAASAAQETPDASAQTRADLTEATRPVRLPLKGDWNFSIGQRGLNEGMDEGFASFVILRSRWDYSFLKNLKAHFEPRFDFYSSRIQERFDDDQYSTRFRIVDGFVDFEPTENLNLRFGTFSQKKLHQPMMISDRRSFPGLQQSYGRTLGGFKISIDAQQLIPTSYSMNTERSEKERVPGFFTEVLSVETADPDNNSVGAQIGHYRWQNIPSKVAFESGIDGNQVIGDAATNAVFQSAFEGYFGTLEACYCVLPRFKLSGSWQRMHNTLASSYAADGQGFTIRPVFVFEDYDLIVDYWKYFVESDVTVAEYSRSSTLGTNREGQEARLKVDLKKLGFAVEGRWGQAQPINPNNIQKTFTEYYLGLESHYVAF